MRWVDPIQTKQKRVAREQRNMYKFKPRTKQEEHLPIRHASNPGDLLKPPYQPWIDYSNSSVFLRRSCRPRLGGNWSTGKCTDGRTVKVLAPLSWERNKHFSGKSLGWFCMVSGFIIYVILILCFYNGFMYGLWFLHVIGIAGMVERNVLGLFLVSRCGMVVVVLACFRWWKHVKPCLLYNI